MDSFGCILSQKDLRDAKFKQSLIGKLKSLPSSYKIESLESIAPKNQGIVNSCVAHAMATILEYYCKDSDTKLSTNFIYGIRRKLFNSKNTCMQIRQACKIANKYGDMLYDDCPGNNEITEVFDIAENAFTSKSKLRHAYRHRIKSYINLFNNELFIKYFILNYGPAIGAIKWHMIYKFDSDKFTLLFDKISKSNDHAVVIYGWDEEGWLCKNSWGKWGRNGNFKLKYENGFVETFGIIDDKDLNDLSEIITDPTHNSECIDKILNVVNNIIAKFTTK